MNDRVGQVLGDETLRLIARELVETVWHVLHKHGYPPGKEEKTTLPVLEQVEDWAE